MLSAFKSAGFRAIAVTNAQRQEAKKRRRDANGGTSEAEDGNDSGRDPSVTPSKNGEPSTVGVGSSIPPSPSIFRVFEVQAA